MVSVGSFVLFAIGADVVVPVRATFPAHGALLDRVGFAAFLFRVGFVDFLVDFLVDFPVAFLNALFAVLHTFPVRVSFLHALPLRLTFSCAYPVRLAFLVRPATPFAVLVRADVIVRGRRALAPRA
jgi:hypothetical protein